MKRTIIYMLLSLGFFSIAQGQADTIQQRIILIGDAGALINGRHPVPAAARKIVPFDKKTLVLYLGDNLYKEGMPDDAYIGYNDAKAVLDSQLQVVENTPARLIMIPGNHDWNNGGREGYQAILREQTYVNVLSKDNVQFYPQDGCPGPVEVQLSKDVVLVLFDSQWWLHPFDKPQVESDCPYKTQSEFLAQLSDILARNFRKLVIIACHHPFRSTGIHGGYFGLKQHIFPFTDKWRNLYIPLPVIGSIYPISRSVFGSPQDLPHPVYTNMVRDIENVAKTHPNVIFAAGHDHNLQLIKDSSYLYVLSGSGSKTSRVANSKKTLFTSDEHGFALIDISVNKNVDISFYVTRPDSIAKAFSEHVLDFSKIPEEKIDTARKTEPIANAELKTRSRLLPANVMLVKMPFSAGPSEKIIERHGLRRSI